MTSRKKPGVAYWATVVVVVALAYALSFGPGSVLFNSDRPPTWVSWFIGEFYRPLIWVAGSSDWTAAVCARYVGFWLGHRLDPATFRN
jgi:hypothetical protein